MMESMGGAIDVDADVIWMPFGFELWVILIYIGYNITYVVPSYITKYFLHHEEKPVLKSDLNPTPISITFTNPSSTEPKKAFFIKSSELTGKEKPMKNYHTIEISFNGPITHNNSHKNALMNPLYISRSRTSAK